MRAVGVEEGAGDIDDGLAPPFEDQPGLLGDMGQGGRLQVLLRRILQEFRLIFGRNDDSHALLGFGDGQFRAVEAFIFFGDQVKIDLQTVGQLADGHGDAARAEVIALLDEAGDLRPAEETLELALGRGIALLDLRAAAGQGLLGVGLGGAGRAADAVAACAAAQQDDHIAGVGIEALYIFTRRGTHDRADFHALGQVAGVIDLTDLTGRQTDLVAVAGITVRRAQDQLFLGELAADGLRDGDGGIRRAGDAHGLIDIAASGERVADGAAQAGRRAAEGLDLSRVVMGLVFKEDQPFLGHRALAVVHLDRDDDGAGVVLVGLFHIRELAVGLELLHTHDGQIHQADRLVRAAGVELLAGVAGALEGRLDGRPVEAVLKADVFELGGKGGVTAVVGPVGVQHADLGDGGIPVLGAAEIGLDKAEIREGHGQAQGIIELAQVSLTHLREAVHDLDIVGLGIFGLQGGGLVHAGLPGIHGVDAVGLDPLHIRFGQIALQQVGDRGPDHGFFFFIEELQALLRAVRALVKLARQRLHGKDLRPCGDLDLLPV